MKNKKYLFICAYGQSRSVFFAERMMEMGFKAAFCGHQPEADLRLTSGIIEHWADVIVILDKNMFREVKLQDWADWYGKEIIQNFIDDAGFENLSADFSVFYEKYFEQPNLEQYRIAIQNANNLFELIDVVKLYGPIEGSHSTYSVNEIVDCLKAVVVHNNMPNLLTRSLGLRDKALSLKK